MLELKSRPTVSKSQARSASDDPQPRRLLLALVLLLVALSAVVVKDRQFWFGVDQSVLDPDGTESAATSNTLESRTAKSTQTTVVVKQAKSAAPATRKQSSAAKPSTDSASDQAPAVSTIRTVLPPLDVEVIAGDNHRTVRPGSNATRVELTRPGQSATGFARATNAAEREQLTTDATQRPTYPLLAQHMNV